MSRYTPKQKSLMRMWQHRQLARINILEGSVSSGKTWISLVLWAFWVKSMPDDKMYMMCAKNLTSLRRNCLLLLQEQIGEKYFQFSLPGKEGYLFGRRILLEGANDARAEAKIRGLTLQGAYCDELTQFPRDFFAMLLSRLRVPDAKLIATTNPDSPSHWLKTDYIDRADELDLLDLKFTMKDNTFLPPEYVKALEAEYEGTVYKKRFIDGEWAKAEGLIYPMYEEAIADPPKDSKATEYQLSIDYGTQNAFAAELWEKHGDIWYMTDLYYYSGRDTGRQKTDDDYYQDLETFIADIPDIDRTPIVTIIDPSAASFIALLHRRPHFRVRKGNNDVIDGLRETAAVMKRGKIKISPKLKDWKREIEGYVWSEKEEDTPVKENDHAMDAMRYFVKTNHLARPETQYISVMR